VLLFASTGGAKTATSLMTVVAWLSASSADVSDSKRLRRHSCQLLLLLLLLLLLPHCALLVRACSHADETQSQHTAAT
jgi:hypothetical protein